MVEEVSFFVAPQSRKIEGRLIVVRTVSRRSSADTLCRIERLLQDMFEVQVLPAISARCHGTVSKSFL